MGKKYNDKVINALFEKKSELFNQKKEIVNKDIEQVFLECYPHGFEAREVENLIEKFFSDTAAFSSKFNRLYLVKQLTYKLLNQSYHQPTINFNHYFDWIGITNKLSEEILIEVLKGMSGNLSKSTYLMNAPHDFYSLNTILLDENFAKSEQHMHINASSLNFNFSYYGLAYTSSTYAKLEALVGTYCCKDKSKQKFNRSILYKTVLLRHTLDILLNGGSLKRKPKKIFNLIYSFNPDDAKHISIADEILRNSKVKINLSSFSFDTKEELIDFLDMERSFIREIVFRYKNHDDYCNPVFMYLYYKNLCHELFVIKKTRSTFAGFKEKEEKKSLFVTKNSDLERLYYRSIYWLYKSDNVNRVEWRTTPDVDYEKQFNRIQEISYNLNNRSIGMDDNLSENFQIKPVIHFIKYEFEANCKHNVPTCFCSKYDEYINMMKKYRMQAYNTKELASEKDKQNCKLSVIGVDAASDELKAPPEILGEAYRILRYNKWTEGKLISCNDPTEPIRFTYHVGEVYANLLTGIRHVDEVVNYLNFQSGDRIGHGVALGIDVLQEYSIKTSTYQKLGERLDDLVWLYDTLVSNHYEDATNILKLKQEIEMYLSKINNEFSDKGFVFTLDEYCKSLKLRSDVYSHAYSKLSYENLIKESYYNSDICTRYNLKLKGYAEAFKNKKAKLLYEYYRTSPIFCDVYNEIIQVKNDQNGLPYMVKFAQTATRKKLARKDITVEVNISSNYFISSMTRYEQHPLFVFVPINKSTIKDSLQVSINTDDASVFQTSLNREYSIIAKTLVSQGYSNIEVCEYIERLIKMSNRTSWI